jgi:hypothetical protein
VLAARAHTALLAGNAPEAVKLAGELLQGWRNSAERLPSYWLAELAFVLSETAGGAKRLAAAVDGATASLWLEAAMAAASQDWIGAARVFAQIGALPEEAYARAKGAHTLCAAGRQHESELELAKALEFYRRVQATGFIGRAERAVVRSS